MGEYRPAGFVCGHIVHAEFGPGRIYQRDEPPMGIVPLEGFVVVQFHDRNVGASGWLQVALSDLVQGHVFTRGVSGHGRNSRLWSYYRCACGLTTRAKRYEVDKDKPCPGAPVTQEVAV